MGTNGASTPEAPGTIREPDLLFEVQEIALETRRALQKMVVAMTICDVWFSFFFLSLKNYFM